MTPEMNGCSLGLSDWHEMGVCASAFIGGSFHLRPVSQGAMPCKRGPSSLVPTSKEAACRGIVCSWALARGHECRWATARGDQGAVGNGKCEMGNGKWEIETEVI